jgi:ribose transport system ATP-binding protein
MNELLEATGIAKAYGAVLALRNANLVVRAGEIHALVGANGAGKSTLVKILTGAVRPDRGLIRIRGEVLGTHSPAEARRIGIASVYQEPALIPDLDVQSNLQLTATPSGPFRRWLSELGLEDLDLRTVARDLPLPVLRVLDLARALALDASLLVLDEMTAALPADLTERVMDVIGRQRSETRAVVFISHRLTEISALCDRATVLRDGETVGVVEVGEGSEEAMVGLMLGGTVAEASGAETVKPAAAARAGGTPRVAVRRLRAGSKLHDVSFELHAGEVLGVVALEGQGQDELFRVLAGAQRPAGGEIRVDGRVVRFGHPADAIRAGLVYVPADRMEALLVQRSVRENVALPFVNTPLRWGAIDMRREARLVDAAITRLRIDTRAGSEVRRLSGGNQQKVTIARWIAAGVGTLLCFDPTRGIDIGTKREIYALLRELAAAGAAVLLYTSELEEIQLACDRAVVIFGGQVVAQLPAAAADEPTLLRAAYGLLANGTAATVSASAQAIAGGQP